MYFPLTLRLSSVQAGPRTGQCGLGMLFWGEVFAKVHLTRGRSVMIANTRFKPSLHAGAVCVLVMVCSICLACEDSGDWRDIYLLPTNGDPDSNIKITLSTGVTQVRSDDKVTVTFEADRDCYLTIMNQGTSGRIIRLWPNEYSKENNFIRANERMRFPSPSAGFSYVIAGPAGTERIVAYATSEKGKILGEDEFRQLRKSGFKEFRGRAKDLTVAFRRNAAKSENWGTAQVNLCITDPPDTGREPTGSSERSLEPNIPITRDSIFIVSIGASSGRVKYANTDAERFAEMMRSKLGVKKSNVKLIVGSLATYDGVEDAMNWLARRTEPSDSAIIYFSGQGTFVPDDPPFDETDGRDECFVLVDPGSSRDHRTALKKRYLIRDDDFNALLKKVPARRKVMVADVCHSDRSVIQDAGDNDGGAPVPKFISMQDTETGSDFEKMDAKSIPSDYGNDHEAVLSACLDNESSYEDPGKGAGLFTFHLLKAIEEGSPNLLIAFNRAKKAIVRETGEWELEYGGKVAVQNPTITDPHGFVDQFEF